MEGSGPSSKEIWLWFDVDISKLRPRAGIQNRVATGADAFVHPRAQHFSSLFENANEGCCVRLKGTKAQNSECVDGTAGRVADKRNPPQKFDHGG